MTELHPPQQDPAFASRPSDDEIDLRALLDVLLRRKWIAVAAAAACIVVGALITLRAPRIYQATTIVLIDRNAPEVLSGVREVYDLGTGNYWASKEYYETQYNLMKSRPVAQKALSTLGISTTAMLDELKGAGEAGLQARVSGDPLQGLSPDAQTRLRGRLELIGLDKVTSRDALIEALENADAAATIQRMVKVTPVKESHLVKIEIEHTNPEVCAQVANAIATAYTEVNLEQKLDLTRTAVDWLGDQMLDLKNKLETSELGLHEFKKANNILSASMEERQTMIQETLSQLNAELSRTTGQRIALESRRNQIARAKADGLPPDSIQQVLASPVIQTLKSSLSELNQEASQLGVKYTAEHPSMVAVRQRIALVEESLNRETSKILRSLDEEYQTAVETEGRLKSVIDGVKTEAIELSMKEIEYSRLTRERDNNKALYTLVLNRKKEADLTQMLRVNNVRVLEAALAPTIPIRPRVHMNMAVALVLGLMLGIGLAFAVDYLDNSLKSQEQVERILALPFLGIVPAIKPEKGSPAVDDRGRDHYIVSHPRSSVAECCRTVRTNLMFMSPEAPARTLMVTSSGPREGKSTTVMNLAITMAQSGARTLIVDTDMRRPRLHKSFKTKNDAGISSLILGEVALERAVQETGIERLHVLPCGPIPPNPAELLHTDAFRHVLESLKQRYDRVIFDSPPVAAVTDAQVLGSMVDGVVLVVNAGKTSWQAALQARRRLQDVGSKIFGVVLNNVDLDDKRSGHYYDYYYYYGTYGDDDKKARASA